MRSQRPGLNDTFLGKTKLFNRILNSLIVSVPKTVGVRKMDAQDIIGYVK